MGQVHWLPQRVKRVAVGTDFVLAIVALWIGHHFHSLDALMMALCGGAYLRAHLPAPFGYLPRRASTSARIDPARAANQHQAAA